MIHDALRDYKIILGSGSPRRKELLTSLGLKFEVKKSNVEETFPEHLSGAEISEYLVKIKALSFNPPTDNELIITGDTIVSDGNRILEKPKDKAEAKQMLKSLSGHHHQVISSYCIYHQSDFEVVSDQTDVHFKELTDEEIDYYVNHYEIFDKAGAYAIQDWIGKIGVKKINGSFYTVMGMPIHLVYQSLQKIVE